MLLAVFVFVLMLLAFKRMLWEDFKFHPFTRSSTKPRVAYSFRGSRGRLKRKAYSRTQISKKRKLSFFINYNDELCKRFKNCTRYKAVNPEGQEIGNWKGCGDIRWKIVANLCRWIFALFYYETEICLFKIRTWNGDLAQSRRSWCQVNHRYNFLQCSFLSLELCKISLFLNAPEVRENKDVRIKMCAVVLGPGVAPGEG